MEINLKEKVFISYSRKDKKWLSRLKTMLKPFERGWELILWDDTKIKPGMEWKKEITSALESSKVAVFLVSPEFLASDFINNVELPELLKARESTGLSVCWILISYCAYETTPLVSLQAAHDISKPIDTLRPAQQNKTLTDIARFINELIVGPQKQISVNTTKKKDDITKEQIAYIDIIDGEIVKESNIIAPLAEFNPWPIIEMPIDKAVIDFPFYVERYVDKLLLDSLMTNNKFFTIWGGKQSGKTSLAIRVALYFREQNQQSLYFSFRNIHTSNRSEEKHLFNTFANDFLQQLNFPQTLISDHLKRIENDVLTSESTSIFIEELLAIIEKPLLIILDDADNLLEKPSGRELIGMIKNLAEKNNYNTKQVWVNCILTISNNPKNMAHKVPEIFFVDNHPLELRDFNLEEIRELNSLHGGILSEEELVNMNQLLGGHPFLIRMAMYILKKDQCNWVELVTRILTKDSPFAIHIEEYKKYINSDKKIREALQQISTGSRLPDESAIQVLEKIGLVHQSSNNIYNLRSGIYTILLK